MPVAGDVARRVAERLDFIGPLAPGMHIVEIGCAEGVLGEALRARVPSLRLTGIEPSADAETARARFDVVHRQPLVPGLLAPADADRVLAFHVLEHLEDPLSAVRLLAEALAPTGRFVIEVPNGSGHPWLPFDGNLENLQYFRAASLACLLARAGLEMVRLVGGGFESPLYPDCLRVEARLVPSAAARAAAMDERWRALASREVVVWGAGGDFETYVRPWLGCLAPRCIVDSDAGRQGRSIDGIPVRAPAALDSLPDATVLVASYRFEASILASLATRGVERQRIVTLSEVYTVEAGIGPRARPSTKSTVSP